MIPQLGLLGKKKIALFLVVYYAILVVVFHFLCFSRIFSLKEVPSLVNVLDITINNDDLLVNFQNWEQTYKYDLKPVSCYASFASHDVNTTVLMYDNEMIDWICGRHSQEYKVAKVMMKVFQKYTNNNKSKSLMLDIGANTGYYSLVAAKMGHMAVQFDLQPECLRILRTSVLANGFNNQIVTIGAGISDTEGSVEVPTNGCDGQFPAVKKVVDAPKKSIPVYPLDNFVNIDGNDIMMMKVDTEGNEKRVLSGAKQFFKNKKINNAIVEVTPCCKLWEKAGINPIEVREIIGEIISYGYVMVSLWDYKIFRTTKEAQIYLKEAPFGQSDMWFTLEDDIDTLVDTLFLKK